MEPHQRWGPCSQDPSRRARGLTGSKRHEVWEVGRLAWLRTWPQHLGTWILRVLALPLEGALCTWTVRPCSLC